MRDDFYLNLILGVFTVAVVIIAIAKYRYENGYSKYSEKL